MKKTYISPNMKIVALRVHHMLCALSGGEGLTNGGNASDAGIKPALLCIFYGFRKLTGGLSPCELCAP